MSRKFQFILTDRAEALMIDLQERLGRLRPLQRVTFTDVIAEALLALDKALKREE